MLCKVWHREMQQQCGHTDEKTCYELSKCAEVHVMHAKGDFLTESESYSMDSKFLYVMWPWLYIKNNPMAGPNMHCGQIVWWIWKVDGLIFFSNTDDVPSIGFLISNMKWKDPIVIMVTYWALFSMWFTNALGVQRSLQQGGRGV